MKAVAFVVLALAGVVAGQIGTTITSSITVVQGILTFLTSTTTVFTGSTQTRTLSPSTITSLDGDFVPTVTVVSTSAAVVTVGSTVTNTVVTTVGLGGTVTLTTTAGTATNFVTVTGPAGTRTVTITAASGATVTSTVTSGSTRINSCLPTTTVIVTTTTSVPTPTSPPGSVVTYNRSNCGVVVCPKNRVVISTGGVAKSCMLTYYGANLVSSTCLVEFCCSVVSGSSPVISNTQCSSAGVTCPAGSVLLTNTAGQFVPCLQYYTNNRITSTTCTPAVCCSVVNPITIPPTVITTTVAPVTVTTGAPAPSATLSCRNTVKCSVYNKDPATNYILKCPDGSCNTSYCCQKV